MKNLTILMLCALTIFSACKKKNEEPVDTREQFLGTWEGTMTVTMPGQSDKTTKADKKVITKTAGTTNKITLTDPSTKEFMTATVNGNSIIFDPEIESVTVGGYTATTTTNGTGVISGKSLNAVGTLKVSVSGTTVEGSWSGTWTKK